MATDLVRFLTILERVPATDYSNDTNLTTERNVLRQRLRSRYAARSVSLYQQCYGE